MAEGADACPIRRQQRIDEAAACGTHPLASLLLTAAHVEHHRDRDRHDFAGEEGQVARDAVVFDDEIVAGQIGH